MMTADPAERRAQFDIEVRAAGLELAESDREALYAMWERHLPLREALRAAVPEPNEEPYR